MAASLNFHQLKLFYTVATLGSISRAASELRISQPSVSAQVRELELRCKVDLLHRSSRGVSLTGPGKAVFVHAEAIFHEAKRLQATLDTFLDAHTGRLVVGGSLTAGEFFLPMVVNRFGAIYPSIEVQTFLGNSAEVLSKVANGQFDLAFVGSDQTGSDLIAIPCWHDEIVIIVPPGLRSHQHGPLTLQSMESQRFVMREVGSATRHCVERTLDRLGLTLKTSLVAGSPEAIKRHVAAGAGWGFASRFSVTDELASGLLEVAPIPAWLCQRTFFAVHQKGYRLTPAEGWFLACAKLLHGEVPHNTGPLKPGSSTLTT